MEFLSNCVQEDIRVKLRQGNPNSSSPDSPTWGFVVVMDTEGIGVSVLSSDVLAYLKRAGEINAAHYPLRMKRSFLIKSGSIISKPWSAVKVLP
jgi:hypothetical protein